jgi:hypothetical protein
MSQPIRVTGAAGGGEGSTGRQIATLLLDKGTIRSVTGRSAKTLGDFFRANAGEFARAPAAT